MRVTNSPRNEAVASTKKSRSSLSTPRKWTVGSSSTSLSSSSGKSITPVEHPSRSCTSLSSAGYEADNEDNGGNDDDENTEKGDATSTNTVSTTSTPSKKLDETTPRGKSLNQEQPGNTQATTEDTAPDHPPSPEAESEVDIEDLLLDICEAHGFYWNTSEEGSR